MIPRWILVVIIIFFVTGIAGANQTIGEITKDITKVPTKEPIEIADKPVYIEKGDTNVTKPEPVKINIISEDKKSSWNTTICAYPNTKYLVESFKATKTVDFVAIPDARDGVEYPLYEAYYTYGKSSLEPWGTYWRVISSNVTQGKYVEMIYADFKTKTVKKVQLTPIEWDYVNKDIDAGVIPDLTLLKEYWGEI